MINDPIFLLGAHKSGTSLLRSLFDGHPSIKTLPIETHFAKLLGWWTKYPMKRNLPVESVGLHEFRQAASSWIAECNAAADPYGDSQATGIFDINAFEHELSDLSEKTEEQDLVREYFRAILRATSNTDIGPEHRVVEKSVENMEHALRLKRIFPHARFIHILRNPYSNLVTLRKYMQKMHPSYPHLDKPVKSIRDSFYFAEMNSQMIDKYMLIRYEDLVRDTENIMQSVASFLDVEYVETLLEPSFQGRDWTGNSVSDGQFTGISTDRLTPWKSEINSLEIKLVNLHLGSAITTQGYEHIPEMGGEYRKIKGERLKEYIGNRLQLKRPL